MVRIAHAEHVIDLTFQPVRRGPDASDAFDGFPFLEPRFHTHVLVLLEGVQDADDLELLVLGPVHRGLVREVVARENGIIAHDGHDLDDQRLFHFDLVLLEEGVSLDELVAELLLQRVHDRMRPGLRSRPLGLRRRRMRAGCCRRLWRWRCCRLRLRRRSWRCLRLLACLRRLVFGILVLFFFSHVFLLLVLIYSGRIRAYTQQKQEIQTHSLRPVNGPFEGGNGRFRSGKRDRKLGTERNLIAVRS